MCLPWAHELQAPFDNLRYLELQCEQEYGFHIFHTKANFASVRELHDSFDGSSKTLRGKNKIPTRNRIVPTLSPLDGVTWSEGNPPNREYVLHILFGERGPCSPRYTMEPMITSPTLYSPL